MTRKIVQIAMSSEGSFHHPHVVALADDGSLWITSVDDNEGSPKNEWFAFPPLPENDSDMDFSEAIRNPVIG